MEMPAPKVVGRRGSRNLSGAPGAPNVLKQDLGVEFKGGR